MADKIKIFDYCFDIPFQWDLTNALSKNCDFYYCLNIRQQWDYTVRPLPNNIQFVSHYEKNLYDVAILHADQNIFNTNHHVRIIYNHFNSIISDIPKIVIYQGVSISPENKVLDYCLTEHEIHTKWINNLKELFGDNVIVLNSCTANSLGFGIQTVIPGKNSSEWYDLPKEPRIITAIPSCGLDTSNYRKWLYNITEELLRKNGYILQIINHNTRFKDYEEYKRYLGKSLLYLDPSIAIPNMNRIEAFISGCCVIHVEENKDLESWAKNEESLIIVPNDSHKISNKIIELIEINYHKAIKIGQEGKKLAIQEFNIEKYRSSWLNILKSILQK